MSCLDALTFLSICITVQQSCSQYGSVPMSDIWFVRAGKDSAFAEDFIQQGVVAIGWPELDDIPTNITKSNLIQLYQQAYKDHSAGRAQVSVSQILRFMNELKPSDFIMTHDRDT